MGYTDKSQPKLNVKKDNKHQNFNGKDNRLPNGQQEKSKAATYNDQDFGHWNGNRRQNSNLTKEEKKISDGMQQLTLGDKNHKSSNRSNQDYHQKQSSENGYQNQYNANRNQSNNDYRVNGKGNDPRFNERSNKYDGNNYQNHNGRGGFSQNKISNNQASIKPVWKEGVKCLAKYWEDGQFYPVTITGLSPTTAVVFFTSYGNYEEVLLEDLLPLPRGNSRDHHGPNEIAPTPGLPPAFRH